MALMDFLFGSPEREEKRLDPNVQALRDSLLATLQAQYENPANMPTYMAVSPESRYTGVNSMLDTMGLDAVRGPDLPTTTINGLTVYDTASLAEAMEKQFREANPDFRTPQEIAAANAARVASAAAAGAPTYYGGGGEAGGNQDPMALHRQILAERDARNGVYSNSLTTGSPSSSSQHVFATADLQGNHGGTPVSQIASGVGNFVSGGGILGAIKNAFSSKKNDDPSIGNVP